MNKPIENWEEAFDEIGFGNQARIPGGKHGAKRVELKDFIRKTLKQEIARVGEEIIGEDEKRTGSEGYTINQSRVTDQYNDYRNLLRTEQRKRLQEILAKL